MRGVSNMLTYLAIGLAVQLLITFERVVIRKVTPSLSDFGPMDWVMFVGVLIIGGISNILAWPITIVAEIFNIKRGA
jgi:hypothetical protein